MTESMSAGGPSKPGFVKLQLRTAYGPVYRDVCTAPPREARPDEIPIIDISKINDDLKQRQLLACQIKQAAETLGFFYAANHGISGEVIQAAQDAARSFFEQAEEEKLKVSKTKSRYFNGYHTKGTSKASSGEGADYREAFMWQYDPIYDPDKKDLNMIPDNVRPWLHGEEFYWQGTSHLPAFRGACITYWQECLKLSRKLVRIFALALDLPEGYFDPLTTYPGADGVLNYYPAMTREQAAASNDVGIGSHTDLQICTLLWQDMIGGLQVLTPEGQWIKASPIEGTFVVNIGDYLMRLTNDGWKSTVHRVFNHSTIDRYSMPFFFGFNFNEKCGVLPSCVSEKNPARYEPISCGDWCLLRFQQTDIEVSTATECSEAAIAKTVETAV